MENMLTHISTFGFSHFGYVFFKRWLEERKPKTCARACSKTRAQSGSSLIHFLEPEFANFVERLSAGASLSVHNFLGTKDWFQKGKNRAFLVVAKNTELV